MSSRLRISIMLFLAGSAFAGPASAQDTPHPLKGGMVSAGIATLRAEGDGIWYPEFHFALTGGKGWGGDLGVGVYSGDGSGVLVDPTVTRVFASNGSAAGFMLMFGPTAIFGEGGTAFGAGLGGALLVRLAPHFGLRIDASPKLYFTGGEAEAAVTLSFSLTSLPGGWRK